MNRRRPHPWLVALAATSLVAWIALALDGDALMAPVFCLAGSWRMPPVSTAFDVLLTAAAPVKIALGAAWMTAAMMLPLAAAPLTHVHNRSFARRRGRAMLLFLSGYMVVWMIATVALQTVALAVRWMAPMALAGIGIVAAAALFWQVSPLKQWCLNRCHRRPQLAAFGLAADRDAIAFGLSNGLSCVGACWAVMLLSLSAAAAPVIVMAAAALFVFAERFDRPAPLTWRWRWPAKAARLGTAQLRLKLGEIGTAAHDLG